jgi:N-acetylmuramoyl-L-alanine amidase
MSGVPEIIDHPSPNHSARKTGMRVDTVLIHHTGSSNGNGPLAWLCVPTSGVSAHYMVGPLGVIHRVVPEHRKAWHAGKGRLPWETCPEYDFNHRSVGIEIVNPGDGKTPFTEAQYRALEWLVPDIVRRLEWSDVHVFGGGREQWTTLLPNARQPIRGTVLGHRDVAPGRKTDPADNFDWGRIRASLAGGQS